MSCHVMYVYVYVYVNVYVYVYLYLYLYVNVYVYVCMYIYILCLECLTGLLLLGRVSRCFERWSRIFLTSGLVVHRLGRFKKEANEKKPQGGAPNRLLSWFISPISLW